MSEVREHVRGEIPGLKDFDAQIDEIEDRLIRLRADRQGLVDATVAGIARLKVGHEYADSRGARFRITKITGDYFASDLVKEPIVWVRYRGVRLYKNGNEGTEQTLYPTGVS